MSDCSTHAYDVPLKPCPFCGGEAALVPTFDTTVREWFVTCSNLECSVLACRTKRYYTEAEAIAAWNTRAERTCSLEGFADVSFNVDYEVDGYDVSSGRDYATLAECSECGVYVIVPPAHHHVLTCDGDEVYQPFNYCPNCGCKVVGE